MKSKKDERVRGRFTTILIERYVLFSAVLLIMVFLALTFTVQNAEEPGRESVMEDLSDAFAGAQPDSYDTVDVEKYLGDRGYVQILDKDLNVIYSSDASKIRTRYTQREVDMISDYNEHVNVSIKEIDDESRGTVSEVTMTHVNTLQDTVRSELFLIDKDGNFIYSSKPVDEKKLSERELNFIDNAVSKRYTVFKYKFIDAEGEERILIGYSGRGHFGNMGRIYDMYFSVAWKFILAYLLLVLVFSLWISKKVGKPLTMLQDAMDSVASGNKGEKLEYSGPKEFVTICDKFNDMSERLAKSEEENRMLQKKKQRLVSNISHDLKTPITVIKGYSRAVLDGVAGKDEERKYLSTINLKAEYMSDLINDFSEYALSGDPDDAYDFRETDICEYMRELFADKYDEFEIAGRTPVMDIPEDEVYTLIDKRKFYRACNNILSNYFKYTPEGSKLFCRIRDDENYIFISLGDDGKGVGDEIKTDIFDPFITGDTARTTGGTGLGLAFVKNVIERHGGTVKLADPPDPGLEFQIIITLKREEKKRADETGSEPEGAADSGL